MKLTKSKLQQIIKEEIDIALGEEETNISAEPMEGGEDQWNIPAIRNKAMDIIETQGKVGYEELKKWFLDNHKHKDPEEQIAFEHAVERGLANLPKRFHYDVENIEDEPGEYVDTLGFFTYGG